MQTIDKRKYFVETYAKIVKEVFPFFFLFHSWLKYTFADFTSVEQTYRILNW